jgi:hypothetical protein
VKVEAGREGRLRGKKEKKGYLGRVEGPVGGRRKRGQERAMGEQI